jgi:biopolymer transport protein ExbB
MHAMYEHFKEGGWGMWPILFWSILTIGIIVERAIYLFGSAINKDVFLATMQKCILAGDVAKAHRLLELCKAVLSR